MPPSHLAVTVPKPSGRYLDFEEREELALLHAQGLGIQEIGRRMEAVSSGGRNTVGEDPLRCAPSPGASGTPTELQRHRTNLPVRESGRPLPHRHRIDLDRQHNMHPLEQEKLFLVGSSHGTITSTIPQGDWDTCVQALLEKKLSPVDTNSEDHCIHSY